MRCIDSKTGQKIEPGSTVTTFRGEAATFMQITASPTEGTSGKVLIEVNGRTREIYPQVIGAKIVQ